MSLDEPFEAESEYLYQKKIKELQEENMRLNNIILGKLSENDGYGFEYTAVVILRKEIDQLKKSIAFASGLISGIPQYQKKHPREIMELLIEYGQSEE